MPPDNQPLDVPSFNQSPLCEGCPVLAEHPRFPCAQNIGRLICLEFNRYNEGERVLTEDQLRSLADSLPSLGELAAACAVRVNINERPPIKFTIRNARGRVLFSRFPYIGMFDNLSMFDNLN